MSKKLISTLIVSTAAIVVFIYWLLFGYGKSNGNPWELIPDDAALVLQIDHPRQFLEKLSDGNEIWGTFKKSADVINLQEDLIHFDSILKSDPALMRLLHIPLFISVHCDSVFNESCFLFISEPNGSQEAKNIKSQLSKHFIIEAAENNSALFLVKAFGEPLFYFGVKNGFLFLSKDKWLANKVSQSNTTTEHFSNQASFKALQNTAGRKVDARLYVNYTNLANLFGHHLSNGEKQAIKWLENFAGWSETDLLIKDDELLLSGFTIANSQHHLSNFLSNDTKKNLVFRILPFNSNMVLGVRFSDIYQVIDPAVLKKLNADLNFDLSMFLDNCNGEMILGSNAHNQKAISSNSWFFLRVENPSRAKQYLNRISQNTGIKTTEKISGHTLREIGHKNLIPNLFGKAYSVIENTWYVMLEDFVVFGNSSESLKKLVRHYESGKTLDLNENFKQFSDNLSDTYIVLLYLKPSALTDVMAKYVNSFTSENLSKNEQVLNDFSGLAFQFLEGDSMYFTNFYLKNSKTTHEENLAIWKLPLDDEITGKPYLVRDHKTNTNNVIVFDMQSNMYLVSTDGQLLWKKRIDGLPESAIEQVDFYKNGKIQYLFNTRDFIYLIDKNGNTLPNYPKKLNPSATNGLTLMDYTNNKNYRLMIAQADKRVHNYTVEGKQVKGWSQPRTIDFVNQQITRLVVNNKDYIIITDIENNINIVDRKGNRRIKLKKNPEKAWNSSFYVNMTNSRGIIITTDKNGKLVYISKSGKLQYTDFGDFSQNHFFLYEDINGDGSKDFIYIDGNQLQVFDRFKNVLFNFTFPSEITIKPEFFKLGRKDNVLGVVADQERTIYLFDKKGNTLINKGLVGEIPFTVGSITNGSEINLITASGNVLFNYRIQ